MVATAWATAKDRPKIEADMRALMVTRSALESRRQALRTVTEPVLKHCTSIRLATWAVLYDTAPIEEGVYFHEDAAPSAAIAAAQIDSLRASVRDELIAQAEVSTEIKCATRDIERLEYALKAIAKKSAHGASKKSSNDGGSLL